MVEPRTRPSPTATRPSTATTPTSNALSWGAWATWYRPTAARISGSTATRIACTGSPASRRPITRTRTATATTIHTTLFMPGNARDRIVVGPPPTGGTVGGERYLGTIHPSTGVPCSATNTHMNATSTRL